MEFVKINEKLEMGKYLVTQLEWIKIMNTNPSYFPKKELSLYPVDSVSWFDAQDFLISFNLKQKDNYLYKLPTSAEWLLAAEAENNLYPWGNKFDPNKCNIESREPTPITKYSNGTSPYGCYDMMGNLWEWCQNWYDNDQSYKILRGGSWDSYQANARCAFRYDQPSERDAGVGFRVARVKRG